MLLTAPDSYSPVTCYLGVPGDCLLPLKVQYAFMEGTCLDRDCRDRVYACAWTRQVLGCLGGRDESQP